MKKGMFKSADLIRIAVETKEWGSVFYNQLKDSMKDASQKKVIEAFAKEEEKHRKELVKINDKVQKKPELMREKKGEAVFLEAFTSRAPFISSKDALGKAQSFDHPSRALEFAIDYEINTVSLYREILELLVSDDEKKVLREIIDQEKVHVTELYNMRNLLIWGDVIID